MAKLSAPTSDSNESFDQGEQAYSWTNALLALFGLIAAHWEWNELLLQLAVADVMQHEFHRVALHKTAAGRRQAPKLGRDPVPSEAEPVMLLLLGATL
jgi:hypothetical protein